MEELWINGIPVMFRAGLDDQDRVRELFIHGGKSGSHIEGLQQDCAVLISRCLQHGDSVEEIRRTLGRQSDGEPASLAGAAMDWLDGIAKEVAEGKR